MDLHLGVTGLRRTGKTVFLTSLVYQLEQIGSRNLGKLEAKQVTLKPAKILFPSEKAGVKPFPYVDYLQDLKNSTPKFPSPTDYEFMCSVRTNCEGNGVKRNLLFQRSGTLRIHLHDYPGEYLLDAEMASQSFGQWSKACLNRMKKQCPAEAAKYIETCRTLPDSDVQEQLIRLRKAYSEFLSSAVKSQMEYVQPAISLLPWLSVGFAEGKHPTEEELPFVPLDQSDLGPEGKAGVKALLPRLWESYNNYVLRRVKPFVRRLQKCEVQLVLVDILRVLRGGVDVYNDTRAALSTILEAYNQTSILVKKRRRVVFAASKADHALKSHRSNLRQLLDELVEKAAAEIPRVKIGKSQFFSSIRATEDRQFDYMGSRCEALYGRLKGDHEPGSHNPGIVGSSWPDEQNWKDESETYTFPEYEPNSFPKKDGTPVPSIGMDNIIWELVRHKVHGK